MMTRCRVGFRLRTLFVTSLGARTAESGFSVRGEL